MMTNKEAKEILIKERDSLKANPLISVDECLYEAYDMAIKELGERYITEIPIVRELRQQISLLKEENRKLYKQNLIYKYVLRRAKHEETAINFNEKEVHKNDDNT